MNTKTTIINVRNGKDLITVDLRVRQIRYLKNVDKQGEIKFMDLSTGDIEGYEWLYNNDRTAFFKTLSEDILNFLGIKTRTKDFSIVNFQ